MKNPFNFNTQHLVIGYANSSSKLKSIFKIFRYELLRYHDIF